LLPRWLTSHFAQTLSAVNSIDVVFYWLKTFRRGRIETICVCFLLEQQKIATRSGE
jgi:hypothetical protein